MVKKKLILFTSYFLVNKVLLPNMGKKNDNRAFSFTRRKRARSKEAEQGRRKREGERDSKLLSRRQLKNSKEREKSLKMAEAKSPPPQYPEILSLRERRKKKKK